MVLQGDVQVDYLSGRIFGAEVLDVNATVYPKVRACSKPNLNHC